MTPAERKFVQRELELRRQYEDGRLPFGDWLKHIRHSYDDLLRILTGESAEGTTAIEIFFMDGTEPFSRTYDIPASCRRIIVNTSVGGLPTGVWGFRANLDLPTQETQVNAAVRDFGPLSVEGGS